jgi:hypothetical protein
MMSAGIEPYARPIPAPTITAPSVTVTREVAVADRAQDDCHDGVADRDHDASDGERDLGATHA